MKGGEIERLVGYLLARGTPILTDYAMRRGEKPMSQHYQEEIERIREIADRMAGRESKFPCPIEDPSFASRIVKEVFEETKREIGDEHEMSEERREEVKEKVKMRVMRKLGLER